MKVARWSKIMGNRDFGQEWAYKSVRHLEELPFSPAKIPADKARSNSHRKRVPEHPHVLPRHHSRKHQKRVVNSSQKRRSKKTSELSKVTHQASLPAFHGEGERAKRFELSTRNSDDAEGEMVAYLPRGENTQIRAQILGVLGRDLSLVVAAWEKLPAALRAAVLAIASTVPKEDSP